MLSEDISNGISGVLNGAGSVVTSAVRGAIMFGLLTIAGGAAIAAIAAIPAIIAATSFIAGLGMFMGALGTGAIGGAAWCMIGAAVGAVVMGVSSLIPGKSEGMSLKNMLSPKAAAPATPELGQSIAPATMPNIDQPDNPYYKPGLGAKILARQQAAASVTNGANR